MNRFHLSQRGFTLVEMMVALVIVALVLTSAYQAIAAFADQRIIMNTRFSGQSVAWNELMVRYQHERGWISGFDTSGFDSGAQESGDLQFNGQQWYWQLEQEQTLGGELRKLTVNAYQNNRPQSGATPDADLVLFVAVPRPSGSIQ